MTEDLPIVFFDGLCELCDASVTMLLRLDRKGRLRFASLQGETAKRLLPQEAVLHLETICVYDRGRFFRRSTAVLYAIGATGGVWGKMASAARLLPVGVRDLVYDFIAERRYRWFGRKDSCRLPSAEERSRFLP